MFQRTILLLIVFIISVGCTTVLQESNFTEEELAQPFTNEPVRMSIAENIHFEIYPALELLAGVQAHTNWVRKRGGFNRYSRDLKSFLGPYKSHAAVEKSQSLLNRGFSYDAPPAFVLCLDESMSPPPQGYSDYLNKRARGEANLEEFRTGLISLAEESGFMAFFNSKQGDYRTWLAASAEGVDGEAMEAWLKEFYGSTREISFHYVLAPAMFPSGGYGFKRRVLRDETEQIQVYQVIRADSNQTTAPGLPSGKNLMYLGLHEFGHSFVNPVVGDKRENFDDPRIQEIYADVHSQMKKMAYGNIGTYYNELVIRAATILGAKDLGVIQESDVRDHLLRQQRIGFKPVAIVYELLQEYQASRDRYPTFDSYVPELLDQLAEREGA